MDKLKEDLHALSDEERENGLKYFDEYFGDKNDEQTAEDDENDENIEDSGDEAVIERTLDGAEVRYGDWVYYTDASGIFKKRANDGSAKTKLSDKRGYNVTPTGEWIFYIFENVIYKTRADGAVTMPITTSYITIIPQIICATNKWVYFFAYHEHETKDEDIWLSVINANAKQYTPLEQNIRSATATNKWLFYDKHDGGLYRIDIRKGNKSKKTETKLCEDKVDSLSINGGLIKWVHYNNLSDDGKSYKIRMDGTHRQVVE